jgi:hypothetical protein
MEIGKGLLADMKDSSGANAGPRVSKAGRERAAAAALFLVFAATASAHHSAAPHFDLEKTVTLQATITQLALVNPHGYLYFTAPGADGKPVPWRCELPSRTALGRLGWTDSMFTPGQKITIKGAPARREENVCMLNSFVRDDGREIKREEDLTKLGVNPLASAAVRNQATTRVARLADGHPNLQGPWVGMGREGRGPGGPGGRGPGGPGGRGPGGPDGRGPGGPGGRGPGGPPGRPEATPAGELAAKSYDQRFDDPAIKCNPANILFGWTHDNHVNEIVQKPDVITFKYGYMDFVRTIHMDVSQHPQKIAPSTGGHSIGKWDGDVLVVDTVGFQPGVLIPIIGLMHSADMHVIERFTVDPNAKTLTREYRAEDPEYLKTPFTGKDFMTLSDEPYSAYNCVELSGKNNIRPKQ